MDNLKWQLSLKVMKSFYLRFGSLQGIVKVLIDEQTVSGFMSHKSIHIYIVLRSTNHIRAFSMCLNKINYSSRK